LEYRRDYFNSGEASDSSGQFKYQVIAYASDLGILGFRDPVPGKPLPSATNVFTHEIKILFHG